MYLINIKMAMCLISPKDYLSLFFLSGIKHRFFERRMRGADSSKKSHENPNPGWGRGY